MKSSTIIIYKSRTGFTKKYAEMIAGELGCTIAEFKTMTVNALSQYDTVIFGSRAHAGVFDGYRKAKEMFQRSSSKNFIVFATGATPNSNEKIIQQFWQQNLSAEEIENLPHFYMQSGLCYEKMGFFDRMMLKMVAAMMKKKKEKSPHEREFEQAIRNSYDISSKEYILPLISQFRE